MKKDYGDNMKEDINFQICYVFLCFPYALQYLFMVYEFHMVIMYLCDFLQRK